MNLQQVGLYQQTTWPFALCTCMLNWTCSIDVHNIPFTEWFPVWTICEYQNHSRTICIPFSYVIRKPFRCTFPFIYHLKSIWDHSGPFGSIRNHSTFPNGFEWNLTLGSVILHTGRKMVTFFRLAKCIFLKFHVKTFSTQMSKILTFI